MEIKGILFDKDGTLIDFYEVWGTAVSPVLDQIIAEYVGIDGRMQGVMVRSKNNEAKIKEKLLECLGVKDGKIDPEGALAWKPYDLIAMDMEKTLQSIFPEKPVKTDALKKRLIQLFHEEVVAKRESYPTFTNLIHLMGNLKKRGIHLGLATTDEEDSSRRCMEKLGIDFFLSFFGTAGEKFPVKPDGKLVEAAAKEWDIAPEEIAVVGDTPNDMRFARNGHAVGIGVLSGTGKRADMQLLADYIIDSVDDLLPLIDDINKKGE